MTRPAAFACLAAAAGALVLAQDRERQWLAGDSHVHSHWSVGYDRSTDPPTPRQGGDAIYATPVNARRAREFGLSWMVTTDHGGPNHSKVNLSGAYDELRQSRRDVPEVLQFYGMELNMPAMDHHTLVIPHSGDEWKTLFNIESQFDANDAWPPDPLRNSEAATFRALAFMNALPALPLMFANHPSRSASGVGLYGLTEPRELRNNHDLAPDVYRGMEGAPGHQAAGLAPDGSIRRDADGNPMGARGSYSNPSAGTFGGYDQMTARVGGVWDALLGEGRRFWIVATSDSHANFSETSQSAGDFWPGQFQKTYVYAGRTYADVLDGLRRGRVFTVAGDLITALDVTVEAAGQRADIGGTLRVLAGTAAKTLIRFVHATAPNARGDRPSVARVDLVAGEVQGPATSRNADRNETTKVVRRLSSSDWTTRDGVTTMEIALGPVARSMYVRVRGTNTADLEPPMDAVGEDPWTDLWFYSNPVFIDVDPTVPPRRSSSTVTDASR